MLLICGILPQTRSESGKILAFHLTSADDFSYFEGS